MNLCVEVYDNLLSVADRFLFGFRLCLFMPFVYRFVLIFFSMISLCFIVELSFCSLVLSYIYFHLSKIILSMHESSFWDKIVNKAIRVCG